MSGYRYVAITPFRKRVYTLFCGGADTMQIAETVSKELGRNVGEHEVANALGRIQQAAHQGELVWPYKRTVRAGVGEITINGSTKK